MGDRLINTTMKNHVTTTDPWDGILTCDVDLSKAELPFILTSGLVVNVLAFIVLQRMRKVCENIDHLLMCILNGNDLLTIVVCIVTWITGWASCGQILINSTVCAIFGWFATTMVVWSAFILVIVASCRYLSLVKPFFYRVYVTRTRVISTSLASLVFGFVLFSFPLTGLGQPYYFYYHNYICAANFAPGGSSVEQRVFVGLVGVMGILTVIHVLVCNFFIIRTLRSRAIVHKNDISTISHSSTVASVAKVPAHGRQQKRIMFERVSLVVSFVYVFCYSPFTARLLVDTAKNLDHQNDLVHSVTMAMLFMSPLLNPVIYGLFNKHFRRTLVGLFHFNRHHDTQITSER